MATEKPVILYSFTGLPLNQQPNIVVVTRPTLILVERRPPPPLWLPRSPPPKSNEK